MTARLLLVLLALSFSFASAASTDLPRAPSTVPVGLGVNIHFTHPKPGELEQLSAAGFTFIRMDLSWVHTEKQRGVYDFSDYDVLLNALDQHDLRALLILDYANPPYDDNQSPRTEEGRKAFARWAAAAVTRFKGRGVLWEMYNEPNISPFWKPKPNVDDYIKLAIAVGKAIREASPEEIYIGPATSGFDWPFLEASFKAGLLEYFDAVSVHPYRQRPPETVIEDYRRLRQLIARHAPQGKEIPVYSGEWGYSDVWPGYSDVIQGAMLPRQFLTNIANDVPLSIWYDWHDDGPDPKEPEYHFGVVRNWYAAGRDPIYDPKPAYLATHKLTSTLRGHRFNKRLFTGSDDDHMLLFSKGDESFVLAAWTTSRQPRQVRIGDVTLALTEEPQYVKSPPNEFFKKLATWERVPLDTPVNAPVEIAGQKITRGHKSFTIDTPFDHDLKIKQRSTVVVTNPIELTIHSPASWFEVHLANPSGEAFDGKLTWNEDSSVAVQLKPGETSKTVSFPQPAKDAHRADVKLLDSSGAVVVAPPPVRFVTIPFFDKEQVEIRAHGDDNVKSTQSFSIGGAPVQLALDYEFEPGWKYLTVATRDDKVKAIEGKPTRLSVWVKGDGSGNKLRARFIDSTGQTFQPDGPALDFTDYRCVSFALDETAQGHWGGANDGIVHYPIKLDALLLIDNVNKSKTSGRVHIMYPLLVYEER